MIFIISIYLYLFYCIRPIYCIQWTLENYFCRIFCDGAMEIYIDSILCLFSKIHVIVKQLITIWYISNFLMAGKIYIFLCLVVLEWNSKNIILFTKTDFFNIMYWFIYHSPYFLISFCDSRFRISSHMI